MRLATLIISLVLMFALGAQSCAVTVGGSLSESFSTTETDKEAGEELAGAGASGVLAAGVWLIGAAFVMSKPKASMWLYLVAAVLCVIGGSTGFPDLFIWAGVSVVFALMSWAGAREVQAVRVVGHGTYRPPPGWDRDPFQGGPAATPQPMSDPRHPPPAPPPPRPQEGQPAPGWWRASDGNWYPPESAALPPPPPPPRRSSDTKKRSPVRWVGPAALVLIGLVAVGALAGSDKDDEQPSETQSPAAQQTYLPGETAHTGDFDVTLNDVRDPFQPANEFEVPSENHRFVAVELTATNTGNDQQTLSTMLGAEVIDSMSRTWDIAIAGTDLPQLDGSVAPGDSRRGWIVFEVASDSTDLKLRIKGNITAKGSVFVVSGQ